MRSKGERFFLGFAIGYAIGGFIVVTVLGGYGILYLFSVVSR